MSTITRHEAGTRIAGKHAGGQFKAQEREVAGPPVAAQSTELALQNAKAAISQAKRIHARATIKYAGELVHAADPDVHAVVLGVTSESGRRTLQFSHLEDCSGEEHFTHSDTLDSDLMNLFIEQDLTDDGFIGTPTERGFEEVIRLPVSKLRALR